MLDIYAVNTTEKGFKNRITLSLRPLPMLSSSTERAMTFLPSAFFLISVKD